MSALEETNLVFQGIVITVSEDLDCKFREQFMNIDLYNSYCRIDAMLSGNETTNWMVFLIQNLALENKCANLENRNVIDIYKGV